jgi:hypothetical protein
MATDTKESAPVHPDVEEGMNVFDENGAWVDGPLYGKPEGRELTAEEVVARKLWLERQEAEARGEERLTEHERQQRRMHPRERFLIHSDARLVESLVVDHTTGTAVITRKIIGANRRGQRSQTGDLTVTIPVSDWSFEPTGREKL